MKKTVKLFGIIALAAVIGFGVLACNNGSDPDDPDTPPQPLFSVSGEFKGAGTGNALFKVATDATVSRSARSATTTYEMSGELEDGDILFRLKGTYDADTGGYILSAAGSFVRYTVNGNAGGATATLAVLDSTTGEWNTFIVSVTIKEVTIAGGDAADQAGGIPEWARGSWEARWTQEDDPTISSFEAWAYFDQWYYFNTRSSIWRGNWDFTSTKYTVVEYEELENGVYDVIFAYPRYVGNKEQIKTAANQFLQSVGVNNAEFWPLDIAPWDNYHLFFNSDWDREQGFSDEDTVVWYICKDPDHHTFGHIRTITWETFLAQVKEKADLNEEDLNSEFWDQFYDGIYEGFGWENRVDNIDKWLWTLKENFEAFFEENGIKQKYYWGWWADDWDENEEHLNRTDTCFAPAEEEGWWDKTRYFIKWGGALGFIGDWEKYGISKWWTDDYLNKYLMSQNVQPETWYSRARLYMRGDEFSFQYYNGDNEGPDNEHSAPACNTKSLSKIKSLTFDPDFWEWSYAYRR